MKNLHIRFLAGFFLIGIILAAYFFLQKNGFISGISEIENSEGVQNKFDSSLTRFSAFPLIGRLPASERLIPKDFLGMDWNGPIFCVQYHCGSDTAFLFRGFRQSAFPLKLKEPFFEVQIDTLRKGKEYRILGVDPFQAPFVFLQNPQAIMGISGCSDSILANQYVEKLRKMTVLWAKP